jgi:small subunit ribosomal protein S1
MVTYDNQSNIREINEKVHDPNQPLDSSRAPLKPMRKISPEPPRIDEGWWEAVLAEEEAEAHAVSANHTAKNSGLNNRANAAHPVEQEEMDWQHANKLYEEDKAAEMVVVGYNRGGLLVNNDDIQGFVPVSHLVETPCTDLESEEWLASYVNRTLLLKVIECDPERGRIVFSERAALSEPGSRIYLLNRLEPGDCIQGTITNITDFGVFVDLGGVEGLIHVSEISWGRVHHPADVVSLGQKVDVYVIQVDRERSRVALSLKRLHQNPWDTVQNRYYPGQITDAVVTSIVPFGAFARLEEGLDGLIHISEMNQVVRAGLLDGPLTEGQQIKVRVLHVDSGRQRLGLSLRLNE